MVTNIKILMIEDSEDDATLVERALKKGGIVPTIKRVDRFADMESAIRNEKWDVIIADYSLPEFRGIEALPILRQVDEDTPFIVVSGTIGEEIAVETMHNGVNDYIMKKNLARLAPAVLREIQQADVHRQKKRTEQVLNRLVTAIEQVAEAVLITDTRGNIQYVNCAFERSSGYSRDEVMGKNPKFLKSGKHDENFYKQMWDTILSGAVWRGQIIDKRKTGELCEEEITITPVMNEAGAIINFAAVKSDITKRRLLEKAQDYFTVVTSHELRTPLTKLELAKFIIGRMEAGIMEEKEKSELKAVMEEAMNDFKRIVSATSIFSELISAKNTQVFQHVDVLRIVKYCVDTARDMARKEMRNIFIKMNTETIDSGNYMRVMCDQGLLARAIEETLSNAIKYTPDEKNINITMRHRDKHVEIEIADEGVGISPEDLETVYKPYFSLEDHYYFSTGRYKFRGGGIGIGLSIARLVMEYHNGSINIHSEGKGKGTTVTLRIPRRETA